MLLTVPMSCLCECVSECQTVCVSNFLMHVYDVCPSWAGQAQKGWGGGGYYRVYKEMKENSSYSTYSPHQVWKIR